MYGRYAYYSGFTPANIVSDVAAILGGETDPANLSADCNQGSTSLTATIAPGWAVHDASAGTDKQVIRAPYADDVSHYKHVELYASTSYFYIYGWDTWDNTAHSGTNKTTNTSYHQNLDNNNGGYLHIFASPQFIAVFAERGAAWGDSSYQGGTLVAELSRGQPWNTVAAAYPNFVVIHTGYCMAANNKGAYLPRVKGLSGSDMTGSSAQTGLQAVGCGYGGWTNANYFPNGADKKVDDGTGTKVPPLFHIFVGDPDAFAMPLGQFSTGCNIFVTSRNLLGNLETVTVSTLDYLGVKASSQGHSLILRKA